MLILLITDPSVLNLLLHVSSVYCVYLLCPLSVLCVFTHTYTYTHIHTYIYVCSKVFFILFHLQNTLCNLFHMEVLNFKRAVNFISWSVFFFLLSIRFIHFILLFFLSLVVFGIQQSLQICLIHITILHPAIPNMCSFFPVILQLPH